MRAEVSGERALDGVRALARFHRVQASPGYDQAAEWVAARLDAIGLAVEREEAAGDGRTRCLGTLMPQGWECSRAVATLVDRDARARLCDYAAEKLSLVLRSAPARGRFPLVALEDGEGSEREVRGAVVLTRTPAHAAHRRLVVEGGAAGILFDGRRLLPPVRDAFDDPDALSYTSFWWNESEPRGWGFVVSPRTGARLRERLRAGARLELEVEIESRAFDTRIPLVSAVIPASGASAGEVLVLAHLCHPEPSANDNASGASAALEAARVLATLRRHGAWAPRARAVRFLWMPELTGTCAWLANDPGRAPGIAAALNLDMVGEDQERCGSTMLVEHPPCFSASFAEELLLRVRRAALDWVPSYSGPGHFSLTRTAEVPYSGGSDHAVLLDGAVGVPCPMLIQWPDRFYHSSHDTPDKCSPGSLALAARCAATYAGFLAAAGGREIEWLAEAVGRGARRRVLDALDAADPSRALARERTRALEALASLERLGAASGPLAAAARAFEAFAGREGECVPECALPARAPGARRLRPRRSSGGPLEYLRHLLPGYDRLAPASRASWERLERDLPGGATSMELAWSACDGSRTLEEIAHLVWLESGARVSADGAGSEPGLRELFDRAAEIGLAAPGGETP
ncbi:MAG TPA: DUF4910 domain-containing protein [Candidatus Eisenbacteria bacterium]